MDLDQTFIPALCECADKKAAATVPKDKHGSPQNKTKANTMSLSCGMAGYLYEAKWQIRMLNEKKILESQTYLGGRWHHFCSCTGRHSRCPMC